MSDNIPEHLRKQVRNQGSGETGGFEPTPPHSEAADERPSTAPPTSAPTTAEVSYENFEFGFTAREQAEGQPVEFDLSVVIDRREAGEPRIKVDIDLGMQNATDVVGGLVTSLAQLLKTAADEASQPKDPDDWEGFIRRLRRQLEKEVQARRILRDSASERLVRRAPFSGERPAQRPPLTRTPPPSKQPGFFERLFDDVFAEGSGEAVEELSTRRPSSATPPPTKSTEPMTAGDLFKEIFGETFDDLFRRKPR